MSAAREHASRQTTSHTVKSGQADEADPLASRRNQRVGRLTLTRRSVARSAIRVIPALATGATGRDQGDNNAAIDGGKK